MSEDSPESTSNTAPASSPAIKPLRTWPAILLLAVMGGMWVLAAVAEPDQPNLSLISLIGRLLAGLLLVVWWLFASRATRKERLGGTVGILVVVGLTYVLLHPSMGIPGMILIAVPAGLAAFGLAAVACCKMEAPRRTALILTATACVFGAALLFRSEGMWSDGTLALQWRWSPNTEEQRIENDAFVIAAADVTPLDATASAYLESPAWPEFRGTGRASRQHGPRLATDWDANPPEERWRIPMGPAWSSFVVAGNLLFTQEQRGDREAVTCYGTASGQLHWITEVASRFSDPLGGPGPRATPTLHDASLYVMGAEGLLLRLDALTGEIDWEVDLRAVADRDPPAWGFSSSPLVIDGRVIVHAGGEGDKGVLAFDVATGKLQWSAPSGDHTYSSPQQAAIGGKAVVLMLTNTGLNVLEPATGASLLDYGWAHGGYRALQPQALDDGSLLLPSGMGTGTRRLKITDAGGTLSAEEVWTDSGLRPDFNDSVILDGYAYGFDGGRFICFNLETGERMWKGGNYGKGQVLLLADAAQLLVTAEKGDVVLLEANPEKHVELTRFRAFGGKTWNHPVLVEDHLYVRNAEEAACYRLPLG